LAEHHYSLGEACFVILVLQRHARFFIEATNFWTKCPENEAGVACALAAVIVSMTRT
jgi:hypothetical protein